MAVIEPKAGHVAFYQDVVELMRKHGGDMTPIEMLAIASQIVGKVLAMQDQRITTKLIALETMKANIEAGNQQAVDDLSKPAGHA